MFFGFLVCFDTALEDVKECPKDVGFEAPFEDCSEILAKGGLLELMKSKEKESLLPVVTLVN